MRRRIGETQTKNLTPSSAGSLRTIGTRFSEDQIPQDDNTDEMLELCLNEEQQKVIKKVLQISRKGRINAHNAFQIPLSKIENQAFLLKNKFWKFASELLGASTTIFDSRIQNTWNNTNKVHCKLLKAEHENPDSDQDSENEEGSTKKKQATQPMILIQELFSPSLMSWRRIGLETLDDEDKINDPTVGAMAFVNSIYKRKMKFQDRSNLKTMLLNVFENDIYLEVKAVHSMFQMDKPAPASPDNMRRVQNIIEGYDPEWSESQQSQLKDYKQYLEQVQTEAFEPEPVIEPDPAESHSIQSQPVFSSAPLHYEQIDESIYDDNSSLIPWELEVYVNKLTTKRLRKPREKNKEKNSKPRGKREDKEIVFDAKETEIKKLIIEKRNKPIPPLKGEEKNLAPLWTNIRDRYSSRRDSAVIKKKIYTSSEDFVDDEYPTFLETEQTFIRRQQETMENSGSMSPFRLQQIQEDEQQKNAQNMMKEIKEDVFEELKDRRELRLSDLSEMINIMSPGGIMVAFLHLANERNLQVTHNLTESDITLSYP